MRWSIDSHGRPLGDLLRSAGYAPHRDPATARSGGADDRREERSREQSFVRRFSAGEFPRFHLYAQKEDNDMVFNLHLDQKKPSYEGSRAHAGEYDGPLLEEERKRIEAIVSRPRAFL